MKKVIRKIEGFLTVLGLFSTLIHRGYFGVNPPRKKDYLGRIIISLLGLFVLAMIVMLAVILLAPYLF